MRMPFDPSAYPMLVFFYLSVCFSLGACVRKLQLVVCGSEDVKQLKKLPNLQLHRVFIS